MGQPGPAGQGVGEGDGRAPGPGRTDPGHRDQHRVRVYPVQLLEVEAPLGERAGGKVLHHHVNLAGEAAQQVRPFRRAQIERQAALVAVEVEEVAAVIRPGPGTQPHRGGEPGRVLPVRGLDLDDVRAMIAEDPRDVGTGEHPGQVKDADSGQGSRRIGVPPR